MQKADYKMRVTFWTFTIAGLFLLLSGWEPIAFSYNNTHPYVILGTPMLMLGFAMMLFAFSQKRFRNQTQAFVTVGLCGLILLGVVSFVIPFLSIPQTLTQIPFNFQTYSIVLGGLGIALSLESIILFAKNNA